MSARDMCSNGFFVTSTSLYDRKTRLLSQVEAARLTKGREFLFMLSSYSYGSWHYICFYGMLDR